MRCAYPLVAVLGIAAGGCDPGLGSSGALPASDAGASPNASILPAPLANEPPDLDAGRQPDATFGGIPADSAGRLILPDAAAPPPEPLRPDVAMPVESPGSKDLAGVSLEATWRWRDVPVPPKAPEVAVDAIREAARLTALTWKIDVTESGRMRAEFTSLALPLPKGSELRARADRYGNVILWPNATDYRVVAPGALRTVLGERRVDVTPLAIAKPVPHGDAKRLGVSTRRVELATSLGSLKLEIGKIAEAGEGGPLLCRALVEVAGIDPKVQVCEPGEVALGAVYAWAEGGGITFDVTAFSRRTDLAPGDVVVPPQGATYASSGLPVAPAGIFLTREELAAFRTAPLALPPKEDRSAPGEGFIAVNQSDTLMYLLVDGVPAVAVPPQSERYLIGTVRGRYLFQWRTFLGDRALPPQLVELPARVVYGAAKDAGSPDGG